MTFDPSTARPADEFDPSTARPVGDAPHPLVNYNPGVGIVESALSLGTGMAGSVAGGISGLGAIATNALGLTDTPPGERVQQVQEALTYRPRTAAGEKITDTIAAPFELLAKGADAAGGYTTDKVGPVSGTAVNTLINSIPMVLGPIARGVPKESAASIAARNRAQSLNAPKDQALANARESGLKVTPSQADGGIVSTTLEGIAGEPKLAKLASEKNAPTINAMIRRDVGLPEDAPITRDALAQIRKDEGAKYEAIKSTGRFGTDAKYQADLHKIGQSYETAAKDFSHRSENPFKKTMEGLNVKSMDAASAIEEVKLLRADADKHFRQGDPQLGKAFKDAAQALDDQIDRHLQRHAAAVNDPQMANAVAEYRAARVRIAKTYAAEKALVGDNIDAAVYAREMKKGKPLTGEAKAVAEFATNFPRSAQPVARVGNTNAPTIFDAAMAIMSKEALLLGARPAARHLMLSDLAQDAYGARNYGTPQIRRLQDLISEIGAEAGAVGTSAGQRK